VEVSWRLRRGADPGSSTNHTIEFLFKLPPIFAGGGTFGVPGMWMKPAERLRGTALAGLAAKLSPGYFFIGLSAAQADNERNLRLLKDRPWIDIPIVYTNNRRAPSLPSRRAVDCPQIGSQRGEGLSSST
jgi:hypothetical protein